jgi:hypothetical protein
MALTFVFDEHVRGPLWQAVLRHNLRGGNPLDVVRVGDTPELPLAIDDPEILVWAERDERILVTEDRHTMVSHLQAHLSVGHRSPGILILRPGQRMRELVECLVLIAYAGEAGDFADMITYIP